jgi:hypothetical protein
VHVIFRVPLRHGALGTAPARFTTVSNLGKENRCVQEHPSHHRDDRRARRLCGRDGRAERFTGAINTDFTDDATLFTNHATVCAVRASDEHVTVGPGRQNAANTCAVNAVHSDTRTIRPGTRSDNAVDTFDDITGTAIAVAGTGAIDAAQSDDRSTWCTWKQ